MPPADEIRALRAQIVEMRLRIDQQGEANAALIRYQVEQEIARVMMGRLPTAEVVEWATRAMVQSEARRKDYRDLAMHSLKLGTAATLAFAALLLWEGLKSRLPWGGRQ